MSDSVGQSKTCPDCGITKLLNEFPRNASRADGHGLYCKGCYSVRYRRHRERKAEAAGRTIREKRVVPLGHKYCAHCQQVLPLDAFGRNRSSGDGLTTYCKPCHNAVGQRNRARKGGSREYHLRRRYGIGQADVDAMLAAQGGVCAACGTDEPAHVDHDHLTGRVRGMLCSLCNQALGNVRDDVNRLRGLADYLRHSRGVAGVVTIELYPAPPLVVEIDRRGFHAA